MFNTLCLCRQNTPTEQYQPITNLHHRRRKTHIREVGLPYKGVEVLIRTKYVPREEIKDDVVQITDTASIPHCTTVLVVPQAAS